MPRVKTMTAVLLGLTAPGALSSKGRSELGAGSIGFRFESLGRLTLFEALDFEARLATRLSPHSLRLTRTKTTSEGVNQHVRNQITQLTAPTWTGAPARS